ncbi:hypothetical protein RAB80_018328 [Fusarium oxysporum f. sp. vasinfectum]|uniref:Uncharacterized protein n=1 Tax=Fusarium oxysporum f. sp. vasinfectum 25433 TaxID=1089449 RepID=X0KSA4_FUSOX|nr:hypothetical protein FOTG_15240 [Fusarium oxysporum f. sp. vasinfectum 25433]KAK2666228.1 hypothetical protein RAB80_018328 [Fusarium oxysporum f. sp. vasinfectum]KAK2922401.1 hypothetical protein FoTM2_017757 [Fusarium oxysporum f. sp. vasinfectum]
MMVTPKPARNAATKRTAHFRDKISAVISRISDAWSAAAVASDHVALEELRKAVSRYDRVLSDLQDQERLAAEDATIHVKIKRKRSSSPSGERKRHCDRGQPNTCPKPTGCLASIEAVEEAPANTLEQTKTANNSHGVIQPKAGELYLAHHKQSQFWLAALLLPLADLHTVGISATIESLGLSKDIPNCVVYNLDSEQFEWRDGYGDGEAFAHERRFPIAYFAGPEFPDSSAAEWIAAEDLRILDESSLQSPVPHCHVMRAFLERRTEHHTLQTATESLDTLLEEQDEDCNTSDGASFGRQKTSPTPKIPTTIHLDVKENPRDVALPRLTSLFKNENGAHFGLFEWSQSLPQRIIDQLVKKSRVKGVEPLPHDFKNARGLLCCPLCRRSKEFVRVTRFTGHLLEKHSG